MQEDYRGYVIKWSDFCGNFDVELEGTTVKSKFGKVEDAQKYIDGLLRKKFKRVPVIVSDWYGEYVEGEISSIIGDSKAFFVSKGKGKGHVSLRRTVVLSDESRAAVASIEERQNLRDKLSAEIREMWDALPKLKPEDVEVTE